MRHDTSIPIDQLRFFLHVDADLCVPRSQPGAFAFIGDDAEGSNTLIPIAWSSKKQSIAADSVGISEVIAAHTGIKDRASRA